MNAIIIAAGLAVIGALMTINIIRHENKEEREREQSRETKDSGDSQD